MASGPWLDQGLAQLKRGDDLPAITDWSINNSYARCSIKLLLIWQVLHLRYMGTTDDPRRGKCLAQAEKNRLVQANQKDERRAARPASSVKCSGGAYAPPLPSR
jgi:hypothetical protein